MHNKARFDCAALIYFVGSVTADVYVESTRQSYLCISMFYVSLAACIGNVSGQGHLYFCKCGMIKVLKLTLGMHYPTVVSTLFISRCN